MKTALPEDIAEFSAVATKRLVRFGGPQAALQAETDDRLRQDARTALSDLGAFDLDVRSSSDDLLAAAVLCQAVGATALPYPLVEELLAIDGARLALVNPEAPRIDHGDLAGDWIAADLDGTRYRVQPSSRTAAKLGPFLVPAALGSPDGTVPAADVELRMEMTLPPADFQFAATGGDRIRLLAAGTLVAELDGRYWTAETCASFTGRVIGLYASQGTVSFAGFRYQGTDG